MAHATVEAGLIGCCPRRRRVLGRYGDLTAIGAERGGNRHHGLGLIVRFATIGSGYGATVTAP